MVRSWGWLLTLSLGLSSQPEGTEPLPSPQRKHKAVLVLTKAKYQNLSGSSSYKFPSVLHEGRFISFTGLWTRLYIGIKGKTIITLRSKILGLLVSAKTGPIYQKQPFILPRTNLGQWEFLQACIHAAMKRLNILRWSDCKTFQKSDFSGVFLESFGEMHLSGLYTKE